MFWPLSIPPINSILLILIIPPKLEGIRHEFSTPA